MKEYSLSMQYAVVGLDGLDSTHPSLAKNGVVRGIRAARLLEQQLFTGAEPEAEEFEAAFNEGLKAVKAMDKKEARQLEAEIVNTLKADGVLEEIQDLLACDMDYDTAGVEIRSYRSLDELYQRIVEGIRAEILEDGPVTLDCGCLLWLCRESGCMHDMFSVKEQEQLETRIVKLTSENPVLRIIWKSEFHTCLEKLSAGFLRGKKNLFKNPYLEGVNLVFPFLDRRQAIFIDFVVLGTNVTSRRMAVMSYLTERGHYVEEVKRGTDTFLRIDNNYYQIFPMTRIYSRIPIQGANLIPVYK